MPVSVYDRGYHHIMTYRQGLIEAIERWAGRLDMPWHLISTPDLMLLCDAVESV